jgi:hypothetical protein
MKSFVNLKRCLCYNNQGTYLQHFIFSVTCKWAQKARVLHYSRLEILVRDKHPSLLDPFVGYAKNEVL